MHALYAIMLTWLLHWAIYLWKESTWQWTEWEQLAFEGLKTALTTAPVLVYPDFIHPFSYATDASDISVGTVL